MISASPVKGGIGFFYKDRQFNEIMINSHIGNTYDIDDMFHYETLADSNFGYLASYGSCYSTKLFKTYDSFWNPTEPIRYEPYNTNQYYTYVSSRYIDLPTKIFHTRSLYPHTTANFTIQTTNTETLSNSIVVENGENYFIEHCFDSSFNISNGIRLENIDSTLASYNENRIVVQNNVYNKVQTARTHTTNFSSIYTETFFLDNSMNDFHLKFQLNYRQKFELYFVAEYEINYESNKWGSGLFNADENWDYTAIDKLGIRSHIFLIPFGVPYFEVTQYYENDNGIDVVYNKSNYSVVYL